mmetsp:Transcript_7877/g.21008  ORF Transcript_7877/g.21008 Transcript_7877/m.21008 type:complete len:205 (+) Transcript_7877:539-1153(+)
MCFARNAAALPPLRQKYDKLAQVRRLGEESVRRAGLVLSTVSNRLATGHGASPGPRGVDEGHSGRRLPRAAATVVGRVVCLRRVGEPGTTTTRSTFGRKARRRIVWRAPARRRRFRIRRWPRRLAQSQNRRSMRPGSGLAALRDVVRGRSSLPATVARRRRSRSVPCFCFYRRVRREWEAAKRVYCEKSRSERDGTNFCEAPLW